MASNEAIQKHPIQISENEDLNYQINTSTSKNTNVKSNEIPFPGSSFSSLEKTNEQFRLENQKLQIEKENILQSLHKEVICNEEQRNYIEILKETINSNLYNSGLANLIKNSTEFKNYESNSLPDFFIDFNKYKSQSEKYRKDSIEANNIIKDNKEQILSLNKKIEDLLSENMLLREKIRTSSQEQIEIVKEIEEQRQNFQNMSNDIENLQKQNVSLKEQVIEYQRLNNMHENQMITSYNQIEKMTRDLSKYKNIEKDFSVLKSEYDSLKNNFVKSQNEKENLYNEIERLKNDNNKNVKSLEVLNEEHQEVINRYHELQNKYEDAMKQNIHVEQLLNKSIQIQEEETKNKQGKSINEYLTTIEGLKSQNCKLNHQIALMNNDINNLQREVYNLGNKNKELNDNLEALTQKNSNIIIQTKNRNDEIQKFLKEKENYNKEILYWKEKYENDMLQKDNDIKRIQEDFIKINNERNNMLRDIENLRKINDDVNNEINIKNDNENKIAKDFEKMKDLYNELNNKYETLLQELKNSENVMNQNAHLEKSLNELNAKNSQEITKKNKLANDLNEVNNKNKKIYDVMSQSINSLNITPKKNLLSTRFKNILSMFNKSQIKPIEELIEDYIVESSIEIGRLIERVSCINIDNQNLNSEILKMEKDKREKMKTYNEMNSKANDISNENARLLDENNNFLLEIENCNKIIEQLKNSCNNYEKSLNTQNKALGNLQYDYSALEGRNAKLANDRDFLETILIRLCKLLSSNTLYRLVHDVIDDNKNPQEIKEINRMLLHELQRAEDYINLIKENSLEAEYLNKQLTKQLEDANMQLLTSQSTLNNSGSFTGSFLSKKYSNY